jgi:predicted  nucleic acid-binding Zn-ribbon protein
MWIFGHLPRIKQRLEAAQMKFLKHLLRITKLDKEKNRYTREKTGAENIVKEVKQYHKKWLQHVQRMDTNRIPKHALQYGQKDAHRTTQEEMEGTTSF